MIKQEILRKLVRTKCLNATEHTAATHAAMFAKRKEGGPIYLTHDSMLLSHAFYSVAKAMEYSKKHVVDIGCGDGSLARNLRNNMRFVPLLGIDVRRPEETGWKLDKASDFLECNFLDGWPLRNDVVECIVASEVIEHFTRDDGMRLLRRVASSLKPGGHFIITLPVTRPVHDADKDYKVFGHLHYWNVEQFETYCNECRMKTTELWASRMIGDRTPMKEYFNAAKKVGKSAHDLLVTTMSRFGQRATRGMFAHLLDPYSATHINAVFTKEAT